MTKRKNLLIIPIVVFMTILFSALTPVSAYAEGENYEPRLTAPNSSISYYSSRLNRYFQTGTPMPNCVAYAYGRIYEMNGEAPLINHGSAGDWYFINKSNGYYPYGSEPKLGAVACWSGHVAIVEKINDDGSVTISESHWGGTYFDTKTFSNIRSHYGQTFYGYIYTYNNGVSKKLAQRLVEAKKDVHDFSESKEIPSASDLTSITDISSPLEETEESLLKNLL